MRVSDSVSGSGTVSVPSSMLLGRVGLLRCCSLLLLHLLRRRDFPALAGMLLASCFLVSAVLRLLVVLAGTLAIAVEGRLVVETCRSLVLRRRRRPRPSCRLRSTNSSSARLVWNRRVRRSRRKWEICLYPASGFVCRRGEMRV